MLSSLSCSYVKLEPSSSADRLSRSSQGRIQSFQPKITSVSGKSNGSNSKGPATKLDLNRSVSSCQTIIHILIATLILAIFLIQGCISENRPCYCNGKYYAQCPKSRPCDPPTFRQPKPLFRSDTYHDYEHPDHILGDSLDPLSPELPFDGDFSRTPRDDLDVVDDDDRVVRHRKVYVSRKSNIDVDPVIHPLQLKIPVKIDQVSQLPPPKPIFKMRKYTTYENQPEIVQVPFTTTVIKPAGVSKDQIIGEDASSLLEKEQIISK